MITTSHHVALPLSFFQFKFPPVSVIVEPPSPILTEQIRSERMETIRIEIEGADDDLDLHNLYCKSDKLSVSDVSNNSSTTNLLTVSIQGTQQNR